jgi:hypothetical protein
VIGDWCYGHFERGPGPDRSRPTHGCLLRLSRPRRCDSARRHPFSGLHSVVASCNGIPSLPGPEPRMRMTTPSKSWLLIWMVLPAISCTHKKFLSSWLAGVYRACPGREEERSSARCTAAHCAFPARRGRARAEARRCTRGWCCRGS